MMAASEYIAPVTGSGPIFIDPFSRSRSRKRIRLVEDQGLLPTLRKAATNLGINRVEDKPFCKQPSDEQSLLQQPLLHEQKVRSHSHYQLFPPRKHSFPEPPRKHSFTETPRKYSVHDPPHTPTDGLAPSPVVFRKDSSTDIKHRPKHIPIVITPYASLLPAKNTSPHSFDIGHSRSNSNASLLSHPTTPPLPQIAAAASTKSSSPLTIASSTNTSPLGNGSFDSGLPKIRHVEIVIPDYAYPVEPVKSYSPFGSSFVSSASASPTTVKPLRLEYNMTSNLAQISPSRPGFGVGRQRNTSFSSAAPPDATSTAMITSNNSPPNATAEDRGIGANYPSSRNGSAVSLSLRDVEAPGTATQTSGNDSLDIGMATAGINTPQNAPAQSGLVCNVHRTTGREPRPSVGATTTILGDKLYVFGGRRLGRTRAALTNDMYELDLIRRHWSKVETYGDLPPPRYFHSVCGLGDTKLVCYGGMSPAPTTQASPPVAGQNQQDAQPEVVVMSDIFIYDVPSRTWTAVHTPDAPQGRYAHCAAILPSSAAFTSATAPLSAIQHNPSSANPNQGQIGTQLDGLGGAEMLVVGGQDSANHYIEQISVFNFRSLQWTSTSVLERSCGAYRSVVVPLNGMKAEKIGMGKRKPSETPEDDADDDSADRSGSAMLIYSNYNFLDVKLELQVRLPDGTLTERPMYGNFSPPGLRFPNGGVINDHFVVSGTFLTSSKQEYALWALDLRTLCWSRIEAGNSTFSQGSWNRGVLWSRRNTFVILGHRKRSLVEDYNHRRLNFSNVCMVELEAVGLYDNPRKTNPTSSYTSTSAAPRSGAQAPWKGGKRLMGAAQDLGQMAMGLGELSDMDFLAIGGERVPVNSRLIAKRWGPYFNQLFRESFANQEGESNSLRPGMMGNPARFSNLTITPSNTSVKTFSSAATTMVNSNPGGDTDSPGGAMQTASNLVNSQFDPPSPHNPNPASRPRTLFLPHSVLTIQALVHYLYTSTLPHADSPLCTPQILCSLLQIARPYHIDGLLEAVIERLHSVLDARNCAAIFNAAAMAAGGGDGVAFITGANLSLAVDRQPSPAPPTATNTGFAPVSLLAQAAQLNTGAPRSSASEATLTPGLRSLRIDTSVPRPPMDGNESEPSSAVSSAADSDFSSQGEDFDEEEVWSGELSAVIGLQKRGLRGLMEGRRIREMGRGSGGQVGGMNRGDGAEGGARVGLGIA